MSAAEVEAAVSQLGETAAYYVDRAMMYGLATPASRSPYDWARTVVGDLVSSDQHVAAEAAQTVVEWCNTESEEWWSSSLGRLIERQITPSDDEDAEITTGQAASLLDVSYSRIDHFIQQRKIRRFRKGILSRADVGRLLAERSAG